MSDVEKNSGTHKPEFDGEWVKLGDVATYVNGYAFKPSDYSADGLPIIRIQNLTGNVYETNRFSGTLPEKFKVANGDILISWSASLGVYRWSHGDAWLNQHIFKVVFDKLPVNVDFFVYQAGYLIENSANLAHGATMRHLTKKVFDSRPFYYPSSAIQARIARNLASIDVLLGSLRCQLSTLDDLVKSQFVEMFGDTYSNSKQLPSRKLGALIDFITSGSRGWSKYYSDEGDYFITIKNVRGCSISLDNVQHVHAPNNKEAERTKVQSGDVLISITADLGRTGVVSKEIADHGAYINQHLACIRLAGEDILPLYLSFFLESPGAKDQLQRKNQTGVKAGLNFDLVKSLDILVPPLALQQQFADFVARVDKLGFDVQQQIEKLETLKQSLMQEYFG